jgi:glycosyltransferase involved in cell wall biosynthesis
MLSIIVNFFNNQREAENTLHSLTRGYQDLAADIPYEVIALDNGSKHRLSAERVGSFGPEFRYKYFTTKSASPAAAINSACRDARGDRLLVIIDGAHIVSPGVLRLTIDAFSLFPAPFVATVPFHLGPQNQMQSILDGYNQAAEDELLMKCGWKRNGYELFKVAGAFADASGGWFGCLFESGCFGMRKVDYLSLGGLDERFQSPGGGIVNLDFFNRALLQQHLKYVMLLGEGSFHQVHGGVASNSTAHTHPWQEFIKEYVRIKRVMYEPVMRRPYYLGTVRHEVMHIVKSSADIGHGLWLKHDQRTA